MWLLLTLLAWLLVAALGMLLLAMITPLRVELALTRDGAWQVSTALRPFAGIGPRIALGSRKKLPKPAREKPIRSRSKPRNPRRIMRAAARLASDILSQVRVHSARCNFRFGMPDPADTGQIFGLISPLIYGSTAMPRTHINIEPVFDQTVISGRVALDLTFVPVALLTSLIRFGWNAFGPQR